VLAVTFLALIISLPALWSNKAGVPFAFYALTGICTLGLYIAYIIPVYLRFRHGERFQRGPWNLGRHYRWINVGAMIFVGLVVISADLPFGHTSVPWNDGFDLTAFNYTPLVIVVGLLVGIWWQLSAKKHYTGPVRTLEEIEEELEGKAPERPEPPTGPRPAPAT
jgi:amino acid transporter